ncbi:MAG: hypothetical protein NT013_25855 [Planctomycetia bacterium]|nr:hypothetical protein [Planctomycetia bacterium]
MNAMKRLIDKLKQHCSISLGSLALCLIVIPDVVFVISLFNLRPERLERQTVWAFIIGGLITGIIGAIAAMIGLVFNVERERCKSALLIFVVSVILLALGIPAATPVS